MDNKKNTSSQETSGQLIVREQKQHLPSTEVREIVTQLREDIDLRDLIDILIRRKSLVLTCLLLCFSLMALYTFTVTPQFRARGVLRVSAFSDNLTKFDSLESSALKTLEFQQTQVMLLQSEQLASRVIHRLNLIENRAFGGKPANMKGEPEQQGLLSTLKSFIRPEEDAATLTMLSPLELQQVLFDKTLARFQALFGVNPIRNSELIEVSFATISPGLAAEITNAIMDEFINMHMDSRLRTSRDATNFLEKQILAAQIKLEKSEKELQEFARKMGIVSLDPKLNLVMRQLEELNEALAQARSSRISKEAIFEQDLEISLGNNFRTVENDLVQKLKSQHASLLAEYRQLGTSFKAAFPKMKQLKALMDEIEKQIIEEQKAIRESVKNEYKTALKTEQYLAVRAEEQKQRAMDLEEKATQYKIYQREVETNKSIYQSLLQRSKEIEATVGAAVTNIQVVDKARPPLYPFKPRVSMNLMIGLALGLAVGVSAALLSEYFDNTIKHPDEMAERFGIPVLGIIPFDRAGVDNRKGMALKFHSDPRSPVAEAVRTTMTSLRLSVTEEPPRTILVTSILSGAGKSSLSCNSCFSYLAEEERCLLVDVDLRKPSLHHVFENGDRNIGLSSVISGMAKLSEVIVPTEYEGLDFISSGPLPPNPAELLSSKRMRQLLQIVSQKYDRVILDGPPYQGFAEILVLSNMVDGVMLVSVEGDTPREGVKQFRRSITNVGGRILGTIINKSGKKKGYNSGSGYKYYTYNYEYGQELEADV